MTRGVSAFPSPFGNDSDLMFAGSGIASRSPGRGQRPEFSATRERAKLAVPVAAQRRRRTSAHAVAERKTPTPPIHYAPFRFEPPERPEQTIRLGRRGFHLRARPREAATAESELAAHEPQSIVIPITIVGVILALSGYVFNFIG